MRDKSAVVRSREGRHNAVVAVRREEDGSFAADLGAGTAPANAASMLRCRSSCDGVDRQDDVGKDVEDREV